MTDGRFATVGEEKLKKILLEKDSINSRRNTAFAVKLFKSYLNTKICNDAFENMDVVTLKSQVTKFYVEVRQENGEKYKKCRLIALRHDGLNIFLQSNSSFDIVNGQEFIESKRVFDAVCKDFKKRRKRWF